MAHDVFISHSSSDKALADAVCAQLEQGGLRCWIAPRDITPGAEWSGAIVDAIRHTRVLLLIFTAHANESAHIKREVDLAVETGVTIVPLRLQDIEPVESLEFFLGNIHWLDAWTPPLEQHLRSLVEKLRPIVQREPVPTMRKVAPPAARRLRAGLVTAGAIALLVAAFLVWNIRKTDEQTEPAPPGEGPSAAAVDPALVGTWEHRTQIGGRDYHVRYSIHPDGDYERLQFVDERGLLEARDGQWRSVESTSGRTDTGVYHLNGANSLTMQTPLPESVQTVSYTRARAGVASEDSLIGTWKAANVWFLGCPWDFLLEVNPDKTYHFRVAANDAGKFTAARGQWSSTSRWQWASGQPSGIYRLKNPNLLEMTVPPLGVGFLERVAE